MSNIPEYWVLFRGAREGWFVWYNNPFQSNGGLQRQWLAQSSAWDGASIYHILDPLTAVLAGLAEPNELVGMPESFKAWLNILKGN